MKGHRFEGELLSQFCGNKGGGTNNPLIDQACWNTSAKSVKRLQRDILELFVEVTIVERRTKSLGVWRYVGWGEAQDMVASKAGQKGTAQRRLGLAEEVGSRLAGCLERVRKVGRNESRAVRYPGCRVTRSELHAIGQTHADLNGMVGVKLNRANCLPNPKASARPENDPANA